MLITPTQQSQYDEQVRVEARILFRLELPSHKSIGVKAKQGKTVAEVNLDHGVDDRVDCKIPL